MQTLAFLLLCTYKKSRAAPAFCTGIYVLSESTGVQWTNLQGVQSVWDQCEDVSNK